MSRPTAIEITPPRTPNDRVLFRRAQGDGPFDAVHVIHRRDRQSSLDASIALAAAGRRPVWHWCARDTRREHAAAELDRAHAAGIDRVLCVLGERGNDLPETPRVRELVAEARTALTDVRVSFDPHRASTRAYANLAKKLEAGATAIQTQLVFAPGDLDTLVGWLAREFPGTAVWPMIVPVLDVAEVRRLRRRLALPVPDALAEAVAGGGTIAGWASFRALAAALSDRPGIGGRVVMTLPMDADPDYRKELHAALGPEAQRR